MLKTLFPVSTLFLVLFVFFTEGTIKQVSSQNVDTVFIIYKNSINGQTRFKQLSGDLIEHSMLYASPEDGANAIKNNLNNFDGSIKIIKDNILVVKGSYEKVEDLSMPVFKVIWHNVFN